MKRSKVFLCLLFISSLLMSCNFSSKSDDDDEPTGQTGQEQIEQQNPQGQQGQNQQGQNQPVVKTIASVGIGTYYPETYLLNEPITLDSLELLVEYSDYSSERIPYDAASPDFKLTGDTSTVGKEKPVKITYKNKWQVECTITVKEITKITYSGYLLQTLYWLNEEPVLDGFITYITYNDGEDDSSDVIEYDKNPELITLKEFDNTKEGLSEIKLETYGKEFSIPVYVTNEQTFVATEIDAYGSYCQSYWVGNTFNPSGLEIGIHHYLDKHGPNTDDNVFSRYVLYNKTPELIPLGELPTFIASGTEIIRVTMYGASTTIDVTVRRSFSYANTDIKYTFDDSTGTLSIYADEYPARIKDYGWNTNSFGDPEYPEWKQYRSQIKKVVFAEGITEIGNESFYNYGNLTEVVFPSTLQRLGYCAFALCSSLKNVELPQGLKAIEDYAFECVPLKTLTLPDTLEELGSLAELKELESLVIPESVKALSGDFMYCENLKSIQIPPTVLKYDGLSLTACEKLEHIDIYDTVTTINSISGCKSLKELVIPDSVYSIGVISGCDLLQELIIPDSVEIMGTISSCASLKSIHYGKGVKKIHGDVGDLFYDLPKLEYLYFNACDFDGVLGNYVPVNNCGNDGEGITLVIGKDMTVIRDRLFVNYGDSSGGEAFTPNKYKELVFEDGCQLKEVGNYAFSGCHFGGKWNIPSGVERFWNNAFSGCDFEGTPSFPPGTEIGGGAFSGNNFSGDLILKDIVWIGGEEDSWQEEDGAGSFQKSGTYRNVYINSVKMPDYLIGYNSISGDVVLDGVQTIGYETFEKCTFNGNIDWGNDIQIIEDYAFAGAVLPETNFIIPETVKEIGNFAFANTNVTKVVFPREMDKLGTFDPEKLFHNDNEAHVGSYYDCVGCFYNCIDLEEIVLPQKLKVIGDGAFADCNKLKEIGNLPEDLEIIGYGAFCRTIAEIHFNKFPDSLKIIGDYAFSARIREQIEDYSEMVQKTAIDVEGKSRNMCLHVEFVTRSVRFYKLRTLENIDRIIVPQFPEGLEKIGDYAFEHYFDCNQDLVLPSAELGKGCFSYCRFNSISFTSSSPETIRDKTFYSVEVNQTSLIIPEGCKKIDYWAFNTSLDAWERSGRLYDCLGTYGIVGCVEIIDLPSSLTEIGSYALSSFQTLFPAKCKTVICRAEVPPSVDYYIGHDLYNEIDTTSIFQESATLYVPRASINAYKNSEYEAWHEFKEIKAIEDMQ